MAEEKDEQLWKKAKARAQFKTHLSIYFIIIALLWAIWLFTSGGKAHPWPIYATLGWGIGVMANYLSVYKAGDLAEKEYDKLKRK
jgi:hypothetical protein